MGHYSVLYTTMVERETTSVLTETIDRSNFNPIRGIRMTGCLFFFLNLRRTHILQFQCDICKFSFTAVLSP